MSSILLRKTDKLGGGNFAAMSSILLYKTDKPGEGNVVGTAFLYIDL